MASRNYQNEQFAFEKSVVWLFMDVAIGATGAPTLTTGRNAGIASISRTSAGIYLITMSDSYNRLMNFETVQVGASQDLTFQVTTDLDTTGKFFSITCKAANTATDPTNGTSLRMTLTLKNSAAL